MFRICMCAHESYLCVRARCVYVYARVVFMCVRENVVFVCASACRRSECRICVCANAFVCVRTHVVFVCARARFIFLYAVKDLSATEMQKYNMAVNNAVHRFLGFRYWQSDRHIREVYRLSIKKMFMAAKQRFLRKKMVHSNGILRFSRPLNPL